MNKPPAQYAVIYCRVSSQKQKKTGHGLDSQELRCRQHAEAMGYVVEATFPDDIRAQQPQTKPFHFIDIPLEEGGAVNPPLPASPHVLHFSYSGIRI